MFPGMRFRGQFGLGMNTDRFNKKVISPKASKTKLSIEQVIGTTSRHNNCVAVNPVNGDIAYAVGCAVALFSPLGEESCRYLVGPKPKSISCLAFAPNGKYLAVGESGYQPSILVYEVSSGRILLELVGHRCGISCVQFDPSCKWLVSVGFHEDKFLHVWDWREKQIVAVNKIANKIYSIDFGDDGTYFVTSGAKHLKIWYLTETCGGPIKKTEKMYKGRAVLDGKMIALGEKHKDCNFMDVCCSKTGSKFIFAITEDAFLIQIDQSLARIEKWVNMKSTAAYGLSVNDNYISVACTDGISRIFNPQNLQYVSTLPKPAAAGYEISSSADSQTDRVYPDVIGIKFIQEDSLLCLYSNRSMVIWDIQDFSKVGIHYSFLGHSACIWDLATLSNGNFVTSSADKTIKFWNLESKIHKTPFSKELVKSLAICDNYAELKMENVAGSENSFLGESGVRCLAVSPDEKHIASGDRAGNLRVHDLDTYHCVATLPAHDSEILSLAYSCPFNDGTKFLASGSRDRLIHIFQRVDGYPDPYSLTATLDDHTSTVTSIKFAEDKGVAKLISTSMDRSIVFRKIAVESGNVSVSTYHREATAQPVYDIEIEPKEQSFVAVGAEAKISMWDVSGGKRSRSIAVADADSVKGKLLKVDFDPSGQFVVTSSQDRYIRLYEVATGNLVAKVFGHSELITALKFTKDCSRILTVSGDGCIFVWSLSNDLTTIMRKRLAEVQDQVPRLCALADAKSQKLNRFAFDHARLPLWAQRSILGDDSDMHSFSSTKSAPRFRGAWAPYFDAIAAIHSALVHVAPKTAPSSRTLKGCSTPGRSNKTQAKTEQFQIDNRPAQMAVPSSAQESGVADDAETVLADDSFTSVSEDNPPDFLLKNYEDFASTFLPNQPKNKNRLTISGKHFVDKLALPDDDELEQEEKENLVVGHVATGNLPAISIKPIAPTPQGCDKKAKWDKEVEKSKQLLRDLGISLEDVPSAKPSLFGTPKASSTLDLCRAGTNMTPAKERDAPKQTDSPCLRIKEQAKQPEQQPEEQQEQSEPASPTISSTPINEPTLSPIQSPTTPDYSSDDPQSLSDSAETRVDSTETDQQPSENENANEIESEAQVGEEAIELKQMTGDDFAATEQYIANLKNVFDQSVNFYWQLMSREEAQGDKATLILNRFHSLFGHMKNQLEDIIPSEEKTQMHLLENYSEMLVSLVKSKLNA